MQFYLLCASRQVRINGNWDPKVHSLLLFKFSEIAIRYEIEKLMISLGELILP